MRIVVVSIPTIIIFTFQKTKYLTSSIFDQNEQIHLNTFSANAVVAWTS